jgi:hypothetical protein
MDDAAGGTAFGPPASANPFPHLGHVTCDPGGSPGDFIVPWQCGQAIFGGLAVDIDEWFPAIDSNVIRGGLLSIAVRAG